MKYEIFYYMTERGDSPIEDFLNALPRKAKAKCIAYMDLLEEFGANLPRDIDLAEIRIKYIQGRLSDESTSPICKRTD